MDSFFAVSHFRYGSNEESFIIYLPLRLPDFGLLVSLGHNVGESGSGDGSHELLSSSRPLLRRLLDHAFAMLAAIQHRPINLRERRI